MATNISKLSEEDIDLLLQTYKYVNGTIDFDGVARDMNIANGEAAKRIRRYFEKANIDVKMVGNRIGTEAQAGSRVMTPRKATASATTSAATKDASTVNAAAKTNKRKTATFASSKKVSKAIAKAESDTEEDEASDGDVEQSPATKKAKHAVASSEEGTDAE